MKESLISFCAITGGKRPEKVERLVRSIRGQGIPRYEIIIAGNPHHIDGVISLSMPEDASNGRLGIMRNAGAKAAKGDYIVSLDDDIVFHPQWWESLVLGTPPDPIKTCRISSPDGTRFWDYAAAPGSPRGQRILNPGEQDDTAYMTGGAGWIMTRKTFERVQWDADDHFVPGEDLRFSLATHALGMKPTHNHECIVYHDDWKYTAFGRSVFLRKISDQDREDLRLKASRMTPIEILNLFESLLKNKSEGDAFDVLRLGRLLHPRSKETWSVHNRLENRLGGPLQDSDWYWDGCPQFWDTMRWADGIK